MKSNSAVMNRTGVATAPTEAKEAITAATATPPSSQGTVHDLDSMRVPYLKDPRPIGSRPAAKGQAGMAIFMDKMGERLAFERSGTRLYQALLGKMRADGKAAGGPPIPEVERIMQEEFRHFQMLGQAVQQLGGDPTIQTPCADLTGVASIGLAQIVTDPRTTVSECLHAFLIAELTDNDGWEMLIQLAGGLGQDQVASQFQQALQEEQEHLEKVRSWILMMTQKEAGLSGALKHAANGRSKRSKA